MSFSKKYNLIILAGGEKGPLSKEYGCNSKALLPIHGKPMLDWVIEAFYNSPYIDNIVVVGGDELDKLSCMRHVRKRLPAGINVIQNLLHGMTYLKTNIYGASDKHNGYLISFCDAVFLNTEIINETIKNINESKSEVVFHYVEKNSFEKANLPAQRTYLPIGGKHYTGTTIYYLKKFRMITKLLDELMRLRENRKDPEKILEMLGCKGKDLAGIESVLSERLSSSVKIYESPHPQLGMDVDKPSDYELAQQKLLSPWRHAYKKAKIIYNPKAGQGMPMSPVLQDLLGIRRRKFEVYSSREGYLEKIQEYFSKYKINFDVTATEYKAHATEIARKCTEEGYDLVVAVGGDGTINEVINGLVGSDVTFGVIPLGTANVFGSEMKIPIEIEAACQAIASGNTRTIDLGKANDRYFACMAGVGFDAHVLRQADTKLKKIFGGLAYIIVGITQLFTYRFRQIVIKVDDQPIRRKGYIAVIGNGKYYAGEMMFASKADLCDGYLDLCIFRHTNPISVFNYLFGFSRGNIDKHLDVEYFQCKKMTVFKKGNHAVHVDAEFLKETPVEIKVCPKALRVAV